MDELTLPWGASTSNPERNDPHTIAGKQRCTGRLDEWSVPVPFPHEVTISLGDADALVCHLAMTVDDHEPREVQDAARRLRSQVDDCVAQVGLFGSETTDDPHGNVPLGGA